MDWRFWAAMVAGLVVASLTDWLFAGILFHDRYGAHPEVWRVNGANPKALIAAQALTIPTVVGLIVLMRWSGHVSLAPALATAALVWAIAAAPTILANGLYIKIHPYIVACHTVGWLAKLAAVALVASFILPH